VALVSLGRRVTTATVRRFSALALRAVAVIAVTGALEALGEVPGRAGLTHTDYGRALLVKLGLAAGVLLLAAVVRLRLLPRAHEEHPPRRLRRLVSVEAAGALAVVLVAAVLANTVPAGEVIDALAAAKVTGGPQQQRLAAGPLRLQLGLEPGTVGLNTLSLQVTNGGGRPVECWARCGSPWPTRPAGSPLSRSPPLEWPPPLTGWPPTRSPSRAAGSSRSRCPPRTRSGRRWSGSPPPPSPRARRHLTRRTRWCWAVGRAAPWWG
jgi:uncharacterized membrane protein